MPAAVLEKPTKELPMRVTKKEPVYVEDGGILFSLPRMEEGRFYCVELNGRPYLYRKVSDSEIEIYGITD